MTTHDLLRVSDDDAEMILTAIRNTRDHWRDRRDEARGHEPIYRLAAEQVLAWDQLAKRVERQLDED